MTRQDFINNIIDEVTISGSLELPVNEKEINRIIDNEKRNVYLNWRNAVESKFTIMNPRAFNTPDFRQSRMIQLPECVWGIEDLREIKGGSRLFGINDPDLSMDRVFGSDIFLSPFSSDVIATRTISYSYFDLMRGFTTYDIQFQFTPNTHRLSIIGHDPVSPVLIRCLCGIQESELLDDYMFYKLIAGKYMINLNRAIKLFQYNLVGGVSIGEQLKEQGEKYIEEVKEYQKGITPPDWFLMFS